MSTEATIEKLNALVYADPAHWLLMAPDGRVWNGTAAEVARVVLTQVDGGALSPPAQAKAQEGEK